MRRPRVASVLLAALLMVTPVGLTACGDDDDTAAPTATAEPTTPTPTEATPTEAPTSEPTAEPTPTVEPTATTEPTAEPTATPAPPSEVFVNVYWAWTIATAPGGSPERLGAGGRTVEGPATARAALEALLAGPDEVETEIGMTTQIPPGTELLDIDIDGGVATVDLSAEFEQSGGTLGETLRAAQVVFTLTQFDTVDVVQFRIEGVDVDALGSHGLDVTDGLTRDDLPDVRPAILLESPVPGASTTSPLRLAGEANTFEATLSYAVTDADGLIVAEGFTTATAGTGTWGTFAIEVPVAFTGRGAVIVWEVSAQDGSQINVVEYPIMVETAGG